MDQNRHGGIRPGSGRKPKERKYQAFTFTTPPEIADFIRMKSELNETSISATITRMIKVIMEMQGEENV